MKNIVIFGGTFDPVHKGHMNVYESVCKELDPDIVYIIPAKIPPHKAESGLVSEQDRLEMCRLAFGGRKNTVVSDFEIKREGKSYSYYTVSHFKKMFPDDKLWFVMGSDMLLSFDKWYKFEEILQLCGILCVSRNKGDRQQLLRKAAELKQYGEVRVISAEPVEISSTAIREMLTNCVDTSCYLDENVVKYIKEKNIYK